MQNSEDMNSHTQLWLSPSTTAIFTPPVPVRRAKPAFKCALSAHIAYP